MITLATNSIWCRYL